jgi:hypothetical protein
VACTTPEQPSVHENGHASPSSRVDRRPSPATYRFRCFGLLLKVNFVCGRRDCVVAFLSWMGLSVN